MPTESPVPAFRPKIRSFRNEKLQLEWGKLTDAEFRLLVIMHSASDDEGRLGADTEQLRVRAFGFDGKVKARDVERRLHSLRRAGFIRLYTVNGTRFAQLLDFDQKIDEAHFTKSRIPPPRPGGLRPKRSPTSKRVKRSTTGNRARAAREAQPSSRERTRARPSPGSDRRGPDRTGQEGPPLTPPPGGVAVIPTPLERLVEQPERVLEPPAVELVEFATSVPFNAVWARYPRAPDRLVSKTSAWRVWRRRRLDARAAEVLAALERQLPHLARDGGRWAPAPDRWLREERWRDEPPALAGLTARTAGNVEILRRFIGRGTGS